MCSFNNTLKLLNYIYKKWDRLFRYFRSITNWFCNYSKSALLQSIKLPYRCQNRFSTFFNYVQSIKIGTRKHKGFKVLLTSSNHITANTILRSSKTELRSYIFLFQSYTICLSNNYHLCALLYNRTCAVISV